MLLRYVAPEKGPARSIDHLGWVLSHPDLSSSAKVLYGLLWRSSADTGKSTVAISSADLATRIGVARNRVSHLIAELRKNAIVKTREQGGGLPLEFTLLAVVLSACLGQPDTSLTLSISGYLDPVLTERDSSSAGVTENANAERLASVENQSLGFPTPLPAREYLYSTSATGAQARELTADEVVLLQKLISHEVHEPVARRRVELFPGRVAMQLESLPFRSNITDKAAFLVAAIDRNLPPAKRAVKYREEQARRAAEKPQISREEQRVIDLQAQRATDAMIDALPFDVRYTIEQRAEQFVATGIFSRLGPNVKRDLRRAKIVEFAREYVCPLQQPVTA